MSSDMHEPSSSSPPAATETPEMASTAAIEAATLASAEYISFAESDLENPQAIDDKIIARLATLKPMEYDRLRREEAKALGIQVKTLDDLVKAARCEDSETALLPFVEVEPYPDPIDPAHVLDSVATIIRRHIVLDQEQADAAALWIAMTWFIDVIDVAAMAIITAPEKACGKSQLLEVFGRLVSRPLPAASSSASFLFRAIGVWKPTVLIDEADTFIRNNDELKGLVNAGHTRANAYVGRTVAVGDSHEPKIFNVWGAKAFAGISLEKHLPDATMSRGIVLTLRRKLPHESVSRLRHADRSSFIEISAKLARFADDYSKEVRTARPVLPDELSDRAQDNWEALIAIAGCAGPEWIRRATVAALKLSSASEVSTSSGNELLADIRDVFEAKRAFKISTVDLITALVADHENAWATYNRGKPLSPSQLARLLAAYDIKPKTVRLVHGTPKGYDLLQFEDAFARYLAPPPNVPPRRNDTPDVNGGDVADDAQPTSNDAGMAEVVPPLDSGEVAEKSPPLGDAPNAGSENVF